MNLTRVATVLISLLVVQSIIGFGLAFQTETYAETDPDVYVGVDLAYGGVSEAKALIDQVHDYTNFIIVGTSRITQDSNGLNQTFQYAYDNGLSFMSLTPWFSPTSNAQPRTNRTEWFNYANQTWGNRLLGFYEGDEPGGKQIDIDEEQTVRVATTPDDVATRYENAINQTLAIARTWSLANTSYPLFTSDYALYWFDYKGGYDGLFAEFGWNFSRPLNVGLCRGAANVLNKEWGVMITWTYRQPPYIESGTELFDDMKLAYDSGAKYIVVFDANEGWTEGILKEEHLEAMQDFWLYIQNNPRKTVPVEDRTAYLLPKNYAYGFRGPIDKLWGLWDGDEFAYNLCVDVNNTLSKYGNKIDIIYDDELAPGLDYGYNQQILWNSTSFHVEPTATPNPSSASSQTAIPETSPSTSSPNQQSTPQPDDKTGNLSQLIWITAVGTTALLVSSAIVFYYKKTNIKSAATGNNSSETLETSPRRYKL